MLPTRPTPPSSAASFDDPAHARFALLAAVVAAARWLPACKVDKAAFHERLYSCNPNAADPACGTDVDDRPMACVPAYQLGGSNFCAIGCDASGNLEAEPATGSACPRARASDRAAAGGRAAAPLQPRPSRQHLRHRGAVLPAHRSHRRRGGVHHGQLVHTDRDCRDPIRSKCMGELCAHTYAKADLKADHTYCLQAECRARRTACSPGETCMRDILPPASNPPDICVPHCDANGNCPPNYFCYPNIYGKGAPRICIPGLLGLRCESRLDCLFGDCVETGAPYKVCSVGLPGRRGLREVRQHPGHLLLQPGRPVHDRARIQRRRLQTRRRMHLSGRGVRLLDHQRAQRFLHARLWRGP